MAASGADGFEAAVANINRCFEREEFEEALPHCVKASELRPNLPVGRTCRVYALLQISKWTEALQILAISKDLPFEHAYCLYRLNRFNEAISVLEKDDGEPSRRARLEAQIRYRMGDYGACAITYETLYKEDSAEVGLLVNAMAARISGDQPRDARNLLKGAQDSLETSYELCFNLACAHIDEGKLAEAEERLQEAKEICKRELMQDEDANNDEAALEDHEDLAAIHVQRGLVLQRRGALDEAHELYTQVLKQGSDAGGEVDVAVLAVACNNVVALRSEGKSLFDSLKRINVASKESLEHKLTRNQNIDIGTNKCLLLLQAHKAEQAKREVQRLRDLYPSDPKVAITQAAILHAEKKYKAAEETLLAFLKEHPASEEVLLSLAQLYAQQNNMDKAVETLAQLPLEQRVQPRALEAITSLQQKQKKTDKAIGSIREAIAYWSSKNAPDDDELFAGVLRIAARKAKQLKDAELAADVYRLYLEKVDGSDVDALCGLVQSLATTDLDSALSYAQRLKLPEYSHLDAEELENAPIPKIAGVLKRRLDEVFNVAPAADPRSKEAAAAAAAAAPDTAKNEDEPTTKPKRKRKIRYPKGFDPANPGPPPDPERWLKKTERSEFKKKMKKRDKNLARGPQGSMPTDDADLRKQGPSTAQVEVAKDGNTGRRQPRKPKAGKK